MTPHTDVLEILSVNGRHVIPKLIGAVCNCPNVIDFARGSDADLAGILPMPFLYSLSTNS
jgi:hypothetical protein